MVPGQTITTTCMPARPEQEGLCGSGSADGSTTTLICAEASRARLEGDCNGVAAEGGRQTFDLAGNATANGRDRPRCVTEAANHAGQDQTFTPDLHTQR